VEAERLAVVIGTGLGAVHTFSAQQERLDKQRPGMVSPYTIPMIMPNGAAAVVSLDLGARAGAHAPMSACASGAEAIAIGLGLIRAGRADVVIAGGVEASLHPLPIAAFTKMGALSKRNDSPESASRPFDVSRDGFVMAEGAGIVVLERPEFAVARQANVYGTLAGTGVTSDAFHMTSPDSTGQCRAIQTALGDAALSPADISHVNAHATGTRMGDQTEALSIAKAIGTHPSVAATKAQTGHLIGAAGAVEAIFTILTIANGVIPASRNLDKTDVGVPIDVVSGRPRAADVPAAISSSFGFGGHSVVLVFTK
jgi:3-oxoacyl-[acyl-carrier-protein] synthase II